MDCLPSSAEGTDVGYGCRAVDGSGAGAADLTVNNENLSLYR